MMNDTESFAEALHRLGIELYEDNWPVVLAHNIKRLIGSEAGIELLNDAQIRTLLVGLRKLKAMRRD